MALIVDNNPTFSVGSLAWPATSYSRSHTHPTGDDGFLMVVVTMQSTTTINELKYGTNAMTLLRTRTNTTQGQRVTIFGMENPPTGANTIAMTMAGAQWGPVSTVAYSFTNCGGFGIDTVDHEDTTPANEAETFTDGSAVFAMGHSNNAATGINIDGNTVTVDYQHNTNKQVFGGVSAPIPDAGLTPVSVTTTYGTLTRIVVEILEVAGVVIELPTLSTRSISNTGRLSSESGGTSVTNGGGTLEYKGICWATTSGPTRANSTNELTTSSTADFDLALSPLLPNVTYYVKAYAKNEAGLVYASEETFKTSRRIIIM